MTSSALWSFYITIVAIVVVAIIWFYLASRHKTRCPRFGSTSVKQIPKQWVTSPMSYRGGPTTLPSHYKYHCCKCQNELEDY